jgi:hypothetical protein
MPMQVRLLPNRPVRCVLVGLFVSALCLSGCGSSAFSSSPAVAPLKTSFYYSTSGGEPVVQARIGKGEPINLVLDTGSVGVRVFARFLNHRNGSGLTLTDRSDDTGFSGGMRLDGVLAFTTVTVAGITTPSIPIQVVQSCKGGCGKGSLWGHGAGQIAGIMGIALSGPTASDPPVNPLQALPGPYSAAWTIRAETPAGSSSTGSLVLAATPPSHPVAEVNLAPTSPKKRNEIQYWNDNPTMCWTFGSIRQYCFPTSFDSGNDVFLVQAADLPDELNPGVIPAGTTMTVSIDGSSKPFWSLDAGNTPDFDLAYASKAVPAYVITGIAAFQTMNVTYDTAQGRLYFADSQRD